MLPEPKETTYKFEKIMAVITPLLKKQITEAPEFGNIIFQIDYRDGCPTRLLTKTERSITF
jgi:hypothetical protein